MYKALENFLWICDTLFTNYTYNDSFPLLTDTLGRSYSAWWTLGRYIKAVIRIRLYLHLFWLRDLPTKRFDWNGKSYWYRLLYKIAWLVQKHWHSLRCLISNRCSRGKLRFNYQKHTMAWKTWSSKKEFFSIAAIWPETPLARKYGVKSDDFEPSSNKKRLEKEGLYYFRPGNPQIEKYFSNCSGTFHFIDEETAIQAKYYLIDSGFIKRFENK